MLTGTPSGKRPLGRPRRRWEDNIRMDLEEIRGIGLIRLRRGLLESSCECDIEPPGFISHVFHKLLSNGNNRSSSYPVHVGLGGLGVTCLPRDPRFAGSNPAEVDGFLGCKNLERKSSGRDLKLVKKLQAWKK